MEFTISNSNNRMAYQLNELLKNNIEPIITSLVLTGTVQLTPSGKLIILMRDNQTCGGYPRILQLNEESINRLSQKHSGKKIKFQISSHDFYSTFSIIQAIPVGNNYSCCRIN